MAHDFVFIAAAFGRSERLSHSNVPTQAASLLVGVLGNRPASYGNVNSQSR